MNNNKKLSYEAPKLDVVVFDAKDIITTSGFPGGELPLGSTSANSDTDGVLF